MYFLFLVALTIIGSVHCAHVNSVDLKIFGGKEVKIEDYNYQVALIKNNELWCGGAIVSPNHVLTAGHCINNANGIDTLTVRAGSSSWAEGGSLHDVKTAIVRSSTTEPNQPKDLGVITVDPPFHFDATRHSVKLGCATLEEGVYATATGWGSIGAGGFSSQLKAADLRVFDKDACSLIYGQEGYGVVSETEMCAGTGNDAACNGDYGGPFVFNGYIQGVSTYSHGCADPKFPGVFTDISYFYKWLKEEIGLRDWSLHDCYSN